MLPKLTPTSSSKLSSPLLWAGLMGTLEDPELAAETPNSLRGKCVITAREAERGVFTSSYSCYSSLRGWVDPQIPLGTNL